MLRADLRHACDLRRLGATILVCLPLTALAPVEARAFLDFFGLFAGDEEEEVVLPDAHPYEVDITVADDPEDELESRLRAASQLFTQRDQIPPSTAALIARARGDYGRLLGALYGDGRYGGTITITIDGREVESIPPGSALPRPAAVSVTVDPGPVFTFGDIAIEGGAPIVRDRNAHIETPEEIGLVTGARARSRTVLRSEDALIEQWRWLGHPTAEIADRRVTAEHRDRTVGVGLSVAPGPAAVYGPVRVTGAEHMNPDFIHRQAGIRQGEPFDPEDLERARDQLRRLQVFQSARIVEAEDVDEEGELPVSINVVERPLRMFGLGGSVSTVDGGALEAYWQHRNLFGQAERLRVEGNISGIGTGDWDTRDGYSYFAGTTFTKPGVFTPYTDFTAHASARLENLESYRDRSALARIGLSHRFTPELRGEWSTQLERSRIEDPLGTRDFLMASLPAQLTFDNRDDDADPTEGVRAWWRSEPFHEFEFGNTGVINEIHAASYLALDEDARFILAGRVRGGSIVGAPRDELPASRLFFAGGGDTIRGYAYRNVGPTLPDGQVVGGRSYFAASAELRARVTDQIGIVPFVDVGNAFESSFPDFSEELRIGAGIGLRYYTTLGPIRLDVAAPVDPRPGDPTVAFYIGLGQAF